MNNLTSERRNHLIYDETSIFLALWAAKISIVVLEITRHNGTQLPGRIAFKICPYFLKYVEKPDTILAITGTNGKTTVSNMIIDILEKR